MKFERQKTNPLPKDPIIIRKGPREAIQVKPLHIRYTADDLMAQFKEIARLFTAVEERVWSEKKVNAEELNVMGKNHKLSPLGIEVLASMVRQSERVAVTEDSGEVWLVPHPEYVVEDLEEEITGVKEWAPAQ